MSFQSQVISSPPARQAYVIEIGETQAGLVARSADERFYIFISASAAWS